jgi:uncharacterized membrane protein
MVALVSVYLIVGGILVLLIKIYPPATVFAPAAFLPLGLVVYTAWATHMELSTWRSGKEDEALERKVRSGLKAEIKALTTERDNLSTECDTLTTERDNLTTECNTLRVQVDTLTQDCNTLSTTRTELLTEVNSLAQQLDTRLHDLDTQAYSPDNSPLQPPDLPGYNPANGPLQQACTTLQPDQPRLTRFSLPTSHDPSLSDQLARVTGTLSTTPDQPNQADDERDVTARETRLDTIVNLLHTNPHLTLSALAEKLTISRTTLYRDLNTLQARGLLSTTKAGTPQNGHGWTVVP